MRQTTAYAPAIPTDHPWRSRLGHADFPDDRGGAHRYGPPPPPWPSQSSRDWPERTVSATERVNDFDTAGVGI